MCPLKRFRIRLKESNVPPLNNDLELDMPQMLILDLRTNANPDLPETVYQISIASDAKPSLPNRNLPILIPPEGPNQPKSAR